MTEFLDQLTRRATSALDDLERARSDGDEYGIRVHMGELESIAQLAAANDVEVAGLEEFGAA